MSEMIERVARGIFASQEWPEFHPAYEESSDIFETAARAAIEAMREPQVEMIAAFYRQKNCGTQEIGERGEATSDYDAWRAAIDAVLQEKEAGE